MAHFAELESKTDPTGFTSDTHLIVKRVVVVANDVVPSDEHADGETWCVNFFGGGTWKQTSYNNNFRKMYAGKGYVYNASKNKFLLKQPYASWSLDGSDDWQAPVTRPNVKDYNHPTETDGNGDPIVCTYFESWDEDNTRWIAKKSHDGSSVRWDADNTEWVSL